MRVGGDGASFAAAEELDAGAAVSARLDLSAISDGRRCQEGPCGQKRGGQRSLGHGASSVRRVRQISIFNAPQPASPLKGGPRP